jgi:hypothetical protein
MWLANSKQQPSFYPPQSHAQEDAQNGQKTENPYGKPVLYQRTFSSAFRAFFTQFNLQSMGSLSVMSCAASVMQCMNYLKQIRDRMYHVLWHEVTELVATQY